MPIISQVIRKPRIRLTKPRLKLPKAPSKTFWYIIIIFIVYFCLAGGVYDIVHQPISVGQDSSGNPILIFTAALGGGLDEQFLLEGLAASILMFFGFIGFLSMYESSKHIYTPNYAYTMLIVGVIFIIVSFAGLQALVAVKIG